MQLIQLLVRDLLIFDLGADRLLVPPVDLAFLAPGKLVKYSAEVPPDLPNSSFLRYFGVNTTWYMHSHVAWFR